MKTIFLGDISTAHSYQALLGVELYCINIVQNNRGLHTALVIDRDDWNNEEIYIMPSYFKSTTVNARSEITRTRARMVLEKPGQR